MRLTLLSLTAAAAATASVAVATAAPASDAISPYGHPYSRRDLLEPLASTKKSQSHKHKRGSCPKRLHQKVLAKEPSQKESSNDENKKDDSDKESEDKAEPALDDASSSSDSTSWVEPSETPAPTSEWKEEAPAAAPTPESTEPAKEEKKEQKKKPEATSTFAEPKPTEKAENKKEKPAQNGGSGGGGAAKWDATCGSSGATEEITKLTGPNGSMDWFNCGLDGAGWTPPSLKMDEIRSIPLDEALEDPNSPFKPCMPYKEIFDKYGHELGIPPILLASFAMQESTCNKDVRGGGGEVGLMQITPDKCTAGTDCADPWYNIGTAARYFKSRLDDNGGQFLPSIGQYNGWSKGLTIYKIVSVRDSCCKCQQNVNYMQQMLNGWLQNVAGYELGDWTGLSDCA